MIPDVEISLILEELSGLIDNVARSVVSEISRGRATGLSNERIMQNITEQIDIPTAPIGSAIGQMAKQTTNGVRKIYGITEQRLSGGLATGADISAILPENLGFLPEPGDTIRLGGNNDYIQRARDRRRQRREAEGTQEETQRRRMEREIDNKLYMWQAIFVNTCPDCVALSGQIRTMKEWKATGLPRQRNTLCDGYCRCSLVPQDVVADMHGLRGSQEEITREIEERHREGITIQKRKIARLEQIRGKKYSKLTKENLLGQANRERFSSKPKTMIDRADEKIPKDFGKKKE